MLITGIIAEYNPFHNGHQFQIEQTRKMGATHIIACMSGSFVQRGDIAVFSKWARTKAALLNGVDLVVELPVPFALSSANTFAFSGVSILNQLGVNALSFGSEIGDIKLLSSVADAVEAAESSQLMGNFLSTGISYPKAREKTLNKMFSKEFSDIISSPNNLLGIEYIRAIKKINPHIIPMTITREAVSHDSKVTEDTFASASYLRDIIYKKDFKNLSKYVPCSAFDIYMEEINQKKAPVSLSNLEQTMLFQLRSMSKEDLKALPDVCEGLENRLYNAINKATSVNELYSLIKTKRYTLARIRRILISGLLDLKASDQKSSPQYIRVLGANQKGMEILKQAKNSSSIPIKTKFADLYKLKSDLIDLDIKATDIYTLASPKIQPASLDFLENTIIIKDN